MELVMEAISAVRARRAEMNVPPSKKARLTVATLETEVFAAGIPFLKRLAHASEVTIEGVSAAADSEQAAQEGMVEVITHAARLFLHLAELVDLDKERERVQKQLKKDRAELEKLDTKLNNPGFVNKAPAHVVQAERERAEKLRALLEQLEQSAAALG